MELCENDRKYGLTFQIPSGIGYRQICELWSDTPFPPIHKGDLIDPRDWRGQSFDMYMELFEYGDLLKAEIIYHHICQEENGKYGNHVIDIFTKVVKK
jgi:hypothetical protein